MTAQRFISEFGLNMCAGLCVLLQDDDLGRLGELTNMPEFHIYVIGARSRIGLDPHRFKFTEQSVSGVFLVHQAGQVIEVPVRWAQNPRKLDRIESDWPHTKFSLYSGNEKILWGKTALLAANCSEMEDYLDLEVLYVGQSFGAQGEREAQERLQSHSTLQLILGEASRKQPDREIWLALFNFEEIQIASFDGRLVKEAGALAADEGRIERFVAGSVSEQQKINFTEAALIRYFQPPYNKTFRTSFPSPAHKTYSECYDLDLNMVAVEMDTESVYSRLFSSSKPKSWIHIATFPLHDSSERRYMMDLLMPGDELGPSP